MWTTRAITTLIATTLLVTMTALAEEAFVVDGMVFGMP